MRQLIVTRHPGLVEWLREHGTIDADAEVVPHTTAEQVTGRHVIGVLPVSLAARCLTYTEVPMRLPPEMRGVELTAAQVEEYRVSDPVTYCVVPEGEWLALERVVYLDGYSGQEMLPDWRGHLEKFGGNCT